MPKKLSKNNHKNNSKDTQVNVFAILSLIFGIVFFIPLAPIAAIVLGFIALSQISKTKEQGRGMAIAGIILGFFWIIMILMIIFFIIIALGSALMMFAPLVQ